MLGVTMGRENIAEQGQEVVQVLVDLLYLLLLCLFVWFCFIALSSL